MLLECDSYACDTCLPHSVLCLHQAHVVSLHCNFSKYIPLDTVRVPGRRIRVWGLFFIFNSAHVENGKHADPLQPEALQGAHGACTILNRLARAQTALQVWKYEGCRTLSYYLKRRDCLQALAKDLEVPEQAVVATVIKQILECLTVRLPACFGSMPGWHLQSLQWRWLLLQAQCLIAPCYPPPQR